jgi:ABC-type amino acid transport substrate-binding protein
MGNLSVQRRSLMVGAMAALVIGHRPVDAAVTAPVIRMEADDDSLPISGRNAQGEFVGMMETTIAIINKELVWRFDFSKQPWKRAQQYVRQGTLDAFCTLSTPERLEYALFSRKPLFIFDSAWVHYAPENPRAAEIARISSLDELKRFRIGLERGESWPNSLFGAGWHVTEVEDTFLLDGMVRAGRIDLFFEVPELMRFFEHGAGRPPLKETRLGFLDGGLAEYRFGLRLSYPAAHERMAEFDRAHASAVSSGDIARALAQFSK